MSIVVHRRSKRPGSVFDIYDDENPSPADVLGRYIASYETQAEANVGAAAPALLSALTAFVAEHDDLQATQYDPVATPPEGGWKCGCGLCVTARAAIAKAVPS